MPRALAAATVAFATLGLTSGSAYASPPSPVTSVTIQPAGAGYANVSWSGQDQSATGVRVCVKIGATASTDPTNCDIQMDRVGQSSTYAQLKPGTTYSFSVFAYSGDGTAREYSQAATTPAWHGSKIALTRPECAAAKPCTLHAQLTDTYQHSAIAGQAVQLWTRPLNGSTEWQSGGSAVTDGNGVAAITMTFPTTRTQQIQWKFAGAEQLLGSDSNTTWFTPTFTVTAHLTKTHARPNEKVKLWGAVQPDEKNVMADLLTYDTRCHGFDGSGTVVSVKRQQLPNGHTTFGYVFVVSRSTPGTTRYEVLIDRQGWPGSKTSPEVTLTVGTATTAVARGYDRATPRVSSC